MRCSPPCFGEEERPPKPGTRQRNWSVATPVSNSRGDNSCEWAGLLGRRDELAKLARQTTNDRPGEARSWLILAQVLPLSEIAEELSALDRAISLNPRFEDAYDHKALALSRNGRFDEAEACLRSGPWGDTSPMTLEGRLAWMQWARGNTSEALERMTGLVERHRDY